LKLALGTVQFGLSYGIANQNGKVNREDANKIINLARLSNIDTIDTAIAYGDSEVCLGNIGMKGFKVITKLPTLPDNVTNVDAWVKNQIQESLQRLNILTVYAVLIHHTQQLLSSKGRDLYQSLERLKAKGLIKKIGVSIYDPSELESVMNSFMIDLVQAPFNLIDQRLNSSGWLQKLYDEGIEVHARSVFLQGLLVMPALSIPEKFKNWLPLFNTWHKWLLENNTLATYACIGFIQAHPQISKAVVGVQSIFQLEQLIQASMQSPITQWPEIRSTDEALINPSNWNTL
jgi:aryl-alcohol dehydrogenase-like predicted oxidoreductase